MKQLHPEGARLTFDPEVMGGKPCIRGLRVTVGTIVGLVAMGYSPQRFYTLTRIWKKMTCAKPWRTLPDVSRNESHRTLDPWQYQARICYLLLFPTNRATTMINTPNGK